MSTAQEEGVSKQNRKYVLAQSVFAPSRMNSISHLKIIEQIKGGLNKEYLEIFKKTSIGHLLNMQEAKFSGTTVNSMLQRVLQPIVGDDPDSIHFLIGDKVIEYGKQESALMTGLSFEGSDVIQGSACAGSELTKKYFPGQTYIKLEELSRKFDSVEHSMDKVKLGLVLLVQGVLMGIQYGKYVNLAYFHMVENIEKFNKFPWGKLCHRMMLRCFRNVVSEKYKVEQIGKSMTNPEDNAAIITYKLYGFPFAFQVWAFESIPLLRKSFARELKFEQFPRVLLNRNWYWNSNPPESSAVENILTSEKIEVLTCIKPTEGEMASKHRALLHLTSVDLSESEDDDEDKAKEMEISMEMQFANEDWEAAKDKDDRAKTQAPQSCSNQDSQLLREVLTQVKELTSKVSRMDEDISKLKDKDNHNYQASAEMEVIDEDERLKGLANDLGEEVYKAFVTVLLEMNDYSVSSLYTLPEWRNLSNGGVEILKEVAAFTLEQRRDLKKKLENNKEIKSLETKMKEMECENKNLMHQNDELRKHYNEEKSKMQQDHKNYLERINREHEDLKLEMESLRKEFAMKDSHLENLNQILINKERKSNDELQEAREELTKELRDMSSRASIGVKRMGELDIKPFYDTCKRRYCSDEADVRAAEICTSWEECLGDPHWHPFKIIEVGNNHQEVINEDDEKLRGLRNEFGAEVYNAVATAVMEMNEYNASGRFVVPELWNFREGRKASLKEVVSHVLKQWKKTLKRKRT